jgi:hypothetical protein
MTGFLPEFWKVKPRRQSSRRRLLKRDNLRRFPNPALFHDNPRAKVKAENICIILAKVVWVCRISGTWTHRYVDK